jgi:hypothetical protein
VYVCMYVCMYVCSPANAFSFSKSSPQDAFEEKVSSNSRVQSYYYVNIFDQQKWPKHWLFGLILQQFMNKR